MIFSQAATWSFSAVLLAPNLPSPHSKSWPSHGSGPSPFRLIDSSGTSSSSSSSSPWRPFLLQGESTQIDGPAGNWASASRAKVASSSIHELHLFILQVVVGVGGILRLLGLLHSGAVTTHRLRSSRAPLLEVGVGVQCKGHQASNELLHNR